MLSICMTLTCDPLTLTWVLIFQAFQMDLPMLVVKMKMYVYLTLTVEHLTLTWVITHQPGKSSQGLNTHTKFEHILTRTAKVSHEDNTFCACGLELDHKDLGQGHLPQNLHMFPRG